MSYAYRAKGRLSEAIEAAEQWATHTDHPFPKYAAMGWLYGLAGRQQDALQMLDQLEQAARRTYVSPNGFGWISKAERTGTEGR